MDVLVDCNVICRSIEPGHVLSAVTLRAMANLRQNGYRLCIVPQVLYELWVVATRPLSANGLGKSTQEAESEVVGARGLFHLLPDPPALFDDWLRLIVRHRCSGKVAHDARLVAAMTAHGVSRLLTFNAADFQRYPALAVLDPATVAASAVP